MKDCCSEQHKIMCNEYMYSYVYVLFGVLLLFSLLKFISSAVVGLARRIISYHITYQYF